MEKADPLLELWSLPLSGEEKRLLNVKLGLLKLEGKDPSVFFTAPDPVDKAGVLRSFLQECAPKIADEDSRDLTFQTVSEVLTPAVPNLSELGAFLLKKADGFKILVSPRTHKRVRDYDLQGLFASSTGDRCFSLEEHLTGCILPVPDTGVTEFSHIQAWDNLINTPLKLSLSAPFTKDRSTNFNTGTTKYLPDLVGYVGAHWSLWLAEEKGEEEGDPLEELISKRQWCYKSIPYILGYYARGLVVTLVALYPEQGKIKSKDLVTFNLADIGHRIKLFMVVFNVGRVLTGLYEMCSKGNDTSEFEVVKTIASGKSVRLAGDKVIKGYPTAEKRMKVWRIYSELRGCPNMEICLSRKPGEERSKKRRRVEEYTLKFTPRLSRRVRARTQESLVAALLHVAAALSWMKKNKWIHRDVHWSNIVFNEATQMWTLIDADEACTFEEANEAHPICEQVHAPEMLTGPHGSAVDVWGLGYLIRSAKNVEVVDMEVDDMVQELMRKCMAMDPKDRPNMEECKAELQKCHDSL